MQTIQLQPIPNQQLTVTLESVQFDITLRTIGLTMYITIAAGGVTILSGSRCVAGMALMPYHYLEGLAGNFAFITANDDLPYYDQFGVSQTLIYATAAELKAIRAV
ncbi:hypothetical protein UFOVP138_53 [uncultured Caudovirales phage]|uniref:Cyanophage baseplate Pam3 plug gp18 domain-containing protein n=1 Tax=uncultured Caudovirales phage TaxID=2100421 RepID=A0A6J5LC01_9CAUD|nr:hypothetical protein UFOVP138_53 [uncultured Caudovirales phage]